MFEVADFENDDFEDILVTFNSTGRTNAPKEWAWYKMTDTASLSFEAQGFTYKEEEDAYSLWQISDLNDDGYLDVIADRGGSSIFENLIMSTSINTLLLENHDKITVYPNPTGEYINIDFGDVKIEKVLIYNPYEEVVRSVLGVSPMLRIDIKELPVGSYSMNIWDSESSVMEQTFIKIGD